MANMANGTISLRTLQTIESAGTKAGNTVIFTLPAEVLSGLKKLIK